MSTPRNPVGWFEIYVQDMQRAKAFYEKTFGQTLGHLADPGSGSGGPALEMWAFPMNPEAGGAPGALCKMDGKDSGTGGTIVYFSCADCGDTAASALANGGAMHLEKTAIDEHGFISLVSDTEGNMIGLHSME